MKNENVITIGEILKECKKKIMLIIGCAVCFAMLMGGVKFYLDSSAVNLNIESGNNTVAPPADMYSEEELNLIERYVDLVKRHENMAKYLDESIYMNLDFSYVYARNTQYKIIVDDVQKQMDVLLYINNYVERGGLVDKIGTAYNGVEPIYLQELIGITSSLDESQEISSNIFNIRVYGRNTDECNRIMQLVENAIFELTQNDVVADFNLEIIDESATVFNSVAISNDQLTKSSKLTDMARSMQNVKDQLTEMQLLTANAILNAEQNLETEAGDANTTEVGISIKFVVLGGIIGIVIGIVLVYVLYYFDSTIKGEDEIVSRYEVQCIGSRNDSEEMVAARITAFCNRKDIKEVVIVVPKTVDKQLIESYGVELERRGIKANFVGDILCDANAVMDMSCKDNVILICRVRYTTYEDMTKMLKFCDMQNMNVLGCITVK